MRVEASVPHPSRFPARLLVCKCILFLSTTSEANAGTFNFCCFFLHSSFLTFHCVFHCILGITLRITSGIYCTLQTYQCLKCTRIVITVTVHILQMETKCLPHCLISKWQSFRSFASESGVGHLIAWLIAFNGFISMLSAYMFLKCATETQYIVLILLTDEKPFVSFNCKFPHESKKFFEYVFDEF